MNLAEAWRTLEAFRLSEQRRMSHPDSIISIVQLGVSECPIVTKELQRRAAFAALAPVLASAPDLPVKAKAVKPGPDVPLLIVKR